MNEPYRYSSFGGYANPDSGDSNPSHEGGSGVLTENSTLLAYKRSLYSLSPSSPDVTPPTSMPLGSGSSAPSYGNEHTHTATDDPFLFDPNVDDDNELYMQGQEGHRFTANGRDYLCASNLNPNARQELDEEATCEDTLLLTNAPLFDSGPYPTRSHLPRSSPPKRPSNKNQRYPSTSSAPDGLSVEGPNKQPKRWETFDDSPYVSICSPSASASPVDQAASYSSPFTGSTQALSSSGQIDSPSADAQAEQDSRFAPLSIMDDGHIQPPTLGNFFVKIGTRPLSDMTAKDRDATQTATFESRAVFSSPYNNQDQVELAVCGNLFPAAITPGTATTYVVTRSNIQYSSALLVEDKLHVTAVYRDGSRAMEIPPQRRGDSTKKAVPLFDQQYDFNGSVLPINDVCMAASSRAKPVYLRFMLRVKDFNTNKQEYLVAFTPAFLAIAHEKYMPQAIALRLGDAIYSSGSVTIDTLFNNLQLLQPAWPLDKCYMTNWLQRISARALAGPLDNNLSRDYFDQWMRLFSLIAYKLCRESDGAAFSHLASFGYIPFMEASSSGLVLSNSQHCRLYFDFPSDAKSTNCVWFSGNGKNFALDVSQLDDLGAFFSADPDALNCTKLLHSDLDPDWAMDLAHLRLTSNKDARPIHGYKPPSAALSSTDTLLS